MGGVEMWRRIADLFIAASPLLHMVISARGPSTRLHLLEP